MSVIERHSASRDDAPPADRHRERPLATLTGDRLCAGCGYNLVGQPVLREPHYAMLIVRCPECATVASVQEYPLLGRWVPRVAGLVAAFWFVACLGLAAASAAILYGRSESIVATASQAYAAWLAERQHAWLLEQQAAGTLGPNSQWLVTQPASGFIMTDPTWLGLQDEDELLREAGGLLAAIDRAALWRWPGLALWAFAIGVFWSVALLHLRTRGRLVAGAVILGLVALFVALRFSPGQWILNLAGWMPLNAVAQRRLAVPVHAANLVFAAIPLAIGLLAGRAVARGMIRALLPPRMRGALAILWTVDGKLPPKPAP